MPKCSVSAVVKCAIARCDLALEMERVAPAYSLVGHWRIPVFLLNLPISGSKAIQQSFIQTKKDKKSQKVSGKCCFPHFTH